MLIELVNESGQNEMPLARTGIPIPAKVAVAVPDHKKEPELKEEPEVIDIASLVADAQMNLTAMHDVALNFSIHESSGRTVITVADETTGEIIREIPSTEFLKLAAKLNEMAGVLFDQKG
jgi:flagellar protein FlaG